MKSDNGNDHRAAAIDLQAEKAARPAAPCASYCYPTLGGGFQVWRASVDSALQQLHYTVVFSDSRIIYPTCCCFTLFRDAQIVSGISFRAGEIQIV